MIEFVGIVICLAAVSTIAYNQTQHKEESDTVLDIDNTMKVFAILGLFLASFIKANSDLLSRSLKNVYTSIIMFYHGSVGVTVTTIFLIFNPDVKLLGHEPIQYFFLGLAVVCSTIAINCNTIAFQSDSSGFVALLGYISLLWAYSADQIIFDEQFYTIELLAACVIFITTFTIAAYKLKEKAAT